MHSRPDGIHFSDAAAPAGMRLYAIGDIHGRLDLLAELHDRISADIERDGIEDWRVVHLGDYIDRGPDSQGVIGFLVEAMQRDARYLCLSGNHDIGLLEFLMKPSLESLFVRYGGIETARSYGVAFDERNLDRFQRDLLAALPDSHLDFLGERPLSVEFGDFFFCHAGVRPGVVLASQDPDDLVWIRREFLDHVHLLEKVVVHGHTIVERPEIRPNRVNVDTGAYQTGRLTALRVDGKMKAFLTTGA